MLEMASTSYGVNRQFYSLPVKSETAVDEDDGDRKEEEVFHDQQSSIDINHQSRLLGDITYDRSRNCVTPSNYKASSLLSYIAENIIGADKVFSGPYGLRKVTYLDFVASGKALKFIEDYIRDEVLSEYGNTHTTTSITSLQTTLFRHEARDVVRNACNASEHDSVIFCGSGSTGAVHKLIHGLNLKHSPIVFVGPFEHHSNILPWKEAGAEVIRIRALKSGHVDIQHLEEMLKVHQDKRRQLIGAFSAASNVTGILTDVNAVTVCLHRHGALAFWDYAAAAPYVKVDVNPYVGGADQHLVYKDAVFFSMHKFVGGTSTPGVLIAKKKLFQNPVPHKCGGGTVFFVRRENHRYLQEPEIKEEGGTPAIVESIRAGLVMQLKQAVGAELIQERDKWLLGQALQAWSQCPNLVMLGPATTEKLPVFSFLIYHPETGHFLHHNFVAAVLNDVFGIQARGGCACAGPYAMDLLGMEERVSKAVEELIAEDSRLDRVHLRRVGEYSHREILRPGFVRLNLPYFLDEPCLGFVLQAVNLVAEHAWKLLPQYLFNPETGEWRQRNFQTFKDRKWLGHISYQSGQMVYGQPRQSKKGPLPSSYQDCLEKARDIFIQAEKLKLKVPDQTVMFDEEAKPYRWFVLPSEASACLQGNYLQQSVSPLDLPFCPEGLLERLGYQRRQTQENRLGVTIEDHHDKLCKTNAENKRGAEEESKANTTVIKLDRYLCAGHQLSSTATSVFTCDPGSDDVEQSSKILESLSEQQIKLKSSQEYCTCEISTCKLCGKIIREGGNISTLHSHSLTEDSFTSDSGFSDGSQCRMQNPHSNSSFSSGMIKALSLGFWEDLNSSQASSQGIEETEIVNLSSDFVNNSDTRWHNSFTAEDQAPSLVLNPQVTSELQETQIETQLSSAPLQPGRNIHEALTEKKKKQSQYPDMNAASVDHVSSPAKNFGDSCVHSDAHIKADSVPSLQATDNIDQLSEQQPATQVKSQSVDSAASHIVCDKEQSSFACKLVQEDDPSPPAGLVKSAVKWFAPPKQIFKPTVTAIEEYGMLSGGDKVLVCLSGGKDSLSLLHTIRQYQFYARSKGINFEFGAVTVDPETPAYDPSPLKQYLATLGVPYFYESQCILETAEKLPYECASICSFCSRMKRGRIYAAARREGYNVLALGQHLDDLAESFLMSFFHNGNLNTMKAHYTVRQGDLRVIRPFVYVREADLRAFAEKKKLPVIAENCPACFEAPKERHRTKQLLAAQEVMFPNVYHSMMAAMKPLMAKRAVSKKSGHGYRKFLQDNDTEENGNDNNNNNNDFDDDDDDE